MNTVRNLSQRVIKNGIKKPISQRILLTKFNYHRFQRNPSLSSPFLRYARNQQKVTLLNRNPSPSFLSKRKFSGMFGASVIGTFIKTSVIFYGIPFFGVCKILWYYGYNTAQTDNPAQ